MNGTTIALNSIDNWFQDKAGDGAAVIANGAVTLTASTGTGNYSLLRYAPVLPSPATTYILRFDMRGVGTIPAAGVRGRASIYYPDAATSRASLEVDSSGDFQEYAISVTTPAIVPDGALLQIVVGIEAGQSGSINVTSPVLETIGGSFGGDQVWMKGAFNIAVSGSTYTISPDTNYRNFGYRSAAYNSTTKVLTMQGRPFGETNGTNTRPVPFVQIPNNATMIGYDVQVASVNPAAGTLGVKFVSRATGAYVDPLNGFGFFLQAR